MDIVADAKWVFRANGSAFALECFLNAHIAHADGILLDTYLNGLEVGYCRGTEV